MTVRVLELTQRYPPALGGVEQHVEHLARELQRAGIRVEVATTDLLKGNPFTRLGVVPASAGVAVRRHRAVRALPAPHGLGTFAPGMLREALRTPCDILHAHAFGYFPTWAASAGRRLRRIGLVVTPHSDEGRGTAASHLYQSVVSRSTLRAADRVIAQTRLEAARLETWGVERSRLVVIPTPIDPGEFEALPRSPSVHRPPVLLFVGRLVLESKGLDVLVRAFARLDPGVVSELRIVGEDWGAREPILRLARELGVGARVRVLGALPRAELIREYGGADIFVLPSRAESFGAVLLEAMASGLPVIATRVGGVPEVVAEGKTALLVPAGDVDALAETLDRMVRDPAVRTRLGANGRERARDFSWERLAPSYVALFNELASNA